MGIWYAVACNGCGYHGHFLVGMGYGFETLAASINKINAGLRPIVRKLLKEHTVSMTDCGYQIFSCESCGQLRNSFWAKILYDADDVYEIELKCENCQNPMAYINEPLQLSQQSCPCCGKRMLRVVENMPWD